MEQIIQVVVGGLLLSVVIYWKGREAYEIVKEILRGGSLRKPTSVIKLSINLAVSVIIASVMIEPFISGNATIEVIAPTKERLPTVLENLRIQATPVGLFGEAGGEFRVTKKFDASNMAIVNVNLAIFQARVELKVYDVSRPTNIVSNKSLYITPFVRRQLSSAKVNLNEEKNGMSNLKSLLNVTLFIALVISLLLRASSASAELTITYPVTDSVVPGEVVEIEGTGADPDGTIEVKVLTNDWYIQDGEVEINASGAWTYGPCHLSGSGRYNNHSIKVTVIKNGERIESVTVRGIVRKE